MTERKCNGRAACRMNISAATEQDWVHVVQQSQRAALAPYLSGCTVVIDLPAKRSSRTQRCMLPSNLKPGVLSPPLVVVLPLVLAFLAARTTRHRRACKRKR